MNSNPLPQMRLAYDTVQESYKIAERAIKTKDPKTRLRLLQRTRLEKESLANAEQIIKASHKESDDLFILALWATFERFIRDDLQIRGKILCHSNPSILGNSIYKHFQKEVEFWKPAEILDCLKESLFKNHANLIGHAKQILAYRDWVAHGKNQKKPPSTDIKPLAAYHTLNEIIETLLRYPVN